jgi:hypothetical protein
MDTKTFTTCLDMKHVKNACVIGEYAISTYSDIEDKKMCPFDKLT